MAMKTTVKPYVGQHCESTATGTLLGQIGIDLSEPMIFGLGEGLGFIFWNMKSMDFPFIGGRVKPDMLTANVARNLGLTLSTYETSSTTKAWKEVKQLLDGGKAVGLKLDCYHLDYFSNPFHFAAHYVAMVGYNETQAFLVDTKQQGTMVKTSLESLARARNEKGPMSSRNLYYILDTNGASAPLDQAVIAAVRTNSRAYLNPPIANLCYRGIEKMSREVVKWFDRSPNLKFEFGTAAMLMERAGTGGALFRNLYRDFLKEAFDVTGHDAIDEAHQAFVGIARAWSEVISLFEKTAETGDRQFVLCISEILLSLAAQEKAAMRVLAGV